MYELEIDPQVGRGFVGLEIPTMWGGTFGKFEGFCGTFQLREPHKPPTQFVGVLMDLWVKSRNVGTKSLIIGTIHVKIHNFASKVLFLWLRFIMG